MAEQLSVGATQPISCWLGELIAITRRAGRFVGGDSGPMHIAYEPGVTVAILGPTDPARNGPHVATSTMLRSTASATFYSHHDRADEALRSTSVSEVLRAALRMGASDV